MNPLTKIALVALAAASVSSAFAGGKVVRIEHGRDGTYTLENTKKTATVAALKGDRAISNAPAVSRADSSRDEEVVIDNGRGERLTFKVRR